MYLVDTNIFLEILLKQDKSAKCRQFLSENIGQLRITDYSLHSIGVILFRQDKEALFLRFLADILPIVDLVSLPKEEYERVAENSEKQKLDFDDAYQYTVCRYYEFELVTMDQDFKTIKDVTLRFL